QALRRKTLYRGYILNDLIISLNISLSLIVALIYSNFLIKSHFFGLPNHTQRHSFNRMLELLKDLSHSSDMVVLRVYQKKSERDQDLSHSGSANMEENRISRPL